MRGLAIGGGLLSFVLGLVALAPADKLVPYLLPASAPLKVYEVSGTLLSGSAGMITARSVSLEDASWTLRPSALLSVAVAADIEARSGGARFSGRVSRNLSGTVRARRVQASLSVADLKPLLKLPFLPVDGQISANFDDIRIEGGVPVHAEGRVTIGDTVWALAKPPAPLGEFAAEVETTPDGISATISDQDAAVELTGSALLSPDGNYRFDAKLRPRPTAPAAVRNNIRAMGRPDSQGWQTVNYKGRLAVTPPAQ